MYNGIGLNTPRGSGTNGHVQRSWAFISHKKSTVTTADNSNSHAAFNRPPNKEILDHDQKRKIEVKCLELEEILEKQGRTPTEIRVQVESFRQKLLSQNKIDLSKDEFGRVSVRDTHQLAEAQKEKNARLREAFNISDRFVDGSSFEVNQRTKESSTSKVVAGQDEQRKAATSSSVSVGNGRNTRDSLSHSRSNEKQTRETKLDDVGKSSHSHSEKLKKRKRSHKSSSHSPTRKRSKKKVKKSKRDSKKRKSHRQKYEGEDKHKDSKNLCLDKTCFDTNYKKSKKQKKKKKRRFIKRKALSNSWEHLRLGEQSGSSSPSSDIEKSSDLVKLSDKDLKVNFKKTFKWNEVDVITDTKFLMQNVENSTRQTSQQLNIQSPRNMTLTENEVEDSKCFQSSSKNIPKASTSLFKKNKHTINTILKKQPTSLEACEFYTTQMSRDESENEADNTNMRCERKSSIKEFTDLTMGYEPENIKMFEQLKSELAAKAKNKIRTMQQLSKILSSSENNEPLNSFADSSFVDTIVSKVSTATVAAAESATRRVCSRSRSRTHSDRQIFESKLSSHSNSSTVSLSSCKESRSPSIPRRYGSPSFLDRRRITSARKRPIPYKRKTTTDSSSYCSSCFSGKSYTSSMSRSPAPNSRYQF